MESPSSKPPFVTDENGERVAVILSIAEFEEIAELLEELVDIKKIEGRRIERSIPHEEAMRLVREDVAVPD